MKNGILAICIMSLLSLQTKAQDSPTVNVDLSGRASYINDRIGSEVQHANSGMKGDYLDLMAISARDSLMPGARC